MKVFRKWWLKKDTEIIQCKDEFNFQDIEDATEEGWRAALEWLLTQSLCGYSSDIVRKELDQ